MLQRWIVTHPKAVKQHYLCLPVKPTVKNRQLFFGLGTFQIALMLEQIGLRSELFDHGDVEVVRSALAVKEFGCIQ